MKCPSCGNDNPAGAAECAHCGLIFQAQPARPTAQRGIRCPNCDTVSSSANTFCGRCGQQLPVVDRDYSTDVQARERNTVLYASKYYVDQLVGQGGMGRVYLAHAIGDDRRVAIKELIRDQRWSAENLTTYLDAMQQEIRILNQLRVVRSVPALIEPYQEWNKRSFFVMEFIEGKNLEQALVERKAPFPVSTVIDWAIQLCEVLQVLHGQEPNPILHQDLTLDNIILRQDTTSTTDIALLDFGVARSVRIGTILDVRGGKEGYAPREQLLTGQPKPQSDLYSLSMCMHRLLTLSEPGEDLPKVAELNSLVKEKEWNWLSDLISINLNQEPQERYESASKMREDLRNKRVSITIRCERCGTENERSLIYCKSCARVLLSAQRKCGKCTEMAPYNAIHCPHCGAEMDRR